MSTPVATSSLLCGSFRSRVMTSTKTADHACEPEGDGLENRQRAGLERHRLQEEHRLESLPVDAREAEEEDEPHDLRGREGEPRAGQDPLLARLMEVLEVLLPVHAMEEPVQDEEQDADRDERDDRLQLLPVPRERGEDGLRDDPGHGARGEREPDPEEDRPTKAAAVADEARHERGEDERGLEPLAEDDEGRVRDHPEVGSRAAPDALLGARERIVERGSGRGELAGVGAAPDELDEAVDALRAVPEVALDLLEERGREPAQPLLGAELEDAVRLEPGLLGLLPVAGRRGRLEAVESGGDDVEVGGLGGLLPFGRVERADERECALGRRLDGLRVGDGVSARRIGEIRAERVERRAQAPRRDRVRAARVGWRSWNAEAAPSRKVTASWISNSSVTRPSCTPRPYSIGTRRRKRSSWPAPRRSSAPTSGEARKAASARSMRASASRRRPVARCGRQLLEPGRERSLGSRSRAAR